VLNLFAFPFSAVCSRSGLASFPAPRESFLVRVLRLLALAFFRSFPRGGVYPLVCATFNVLFPQRGVSSGMRKDSSREREYSENAKAQRLNTESAKENSKRSRTNFTCGTARTPTKQTHPIPNTAQLSLAHTRPSTVLTHQTVFGKKSLVCVGSSPGAAPFPMFGPLTSSAGPGPSSGSHR
jgi:hypothetical protein